MTLPRSAADVLARHVVFELECIDRVYGNLSEPSRCKPKDGAIGAGSVDFDCEDDPHAIRNGSNGFKIVSTERETHHLVGMRYV